MMKAHENLVILDFGSQLTQLIARRIREQGVYAEILPFNAPIADIRRRSPLGIVLSGGPSSIYDKNAPRMNPAIFELGLPVLGICYGLYVIVDSLGGSVVRAGEREYGQSLLRVAELSGPITSLAEGAERSDNIRVWMSHGDKVESLPSGFRRLAYTANCECAAIADPDRKIWGVQFHPEVSHTEGGDRLFAGFLDLCGFARDWSMDSFVNEAVESIRSQVGEQGTVICGLSGGVDSSVAAVLVERAIGERLRCIFVDNGLLRKNERRQVEEMFAGRLANPLIVVDAGEQFLQELKGVRDPEVKRKRIGATFIRVFEAEAKKLATTNSPSADFLVQGTLYPDIIESRSIHGPSATIKTHHNVGGLPERMNMKLVEPLRDLFKDEVRRVGEHCGLSADMVWRHPFPGPGLAIRILGEVSHERCEILREADAIIIEEIRKAGVYRQLWQAFGVLLPLRTVGVMGDARSYENALALRAVESRDAMTADWAHLDYELLGRISNRIINEVREINRVCYDISSKPPATIEWE